MLLFQDIAVIPMLAVFPMLATGPATPGEAGAHTGTALAALPGWAQTFAVLGAVTIIVVGGRYLIRPVFRAIAKARAREAFTAAALLMVIGVALLMTSVGLSPALGAFLAGVMLATSEYRHELVSDIEPFKGLLLGLFFIAVGASIDFRLVAGQPALVGGLVIAVIVLKAGVLFGLACGFRLGMGQSLTFALGLSQVGEFAFVLLSFAGQEGVLGASITSPLVAVVAISMAVTPLLFMLNERLLQPRVGARGRRHVTPTPSKNRPRYWLPGTGHSARPWGGCCAPTVCWLPCWISTPTGSTCCGKWVRRCTTGTRRGWTCCMRQARNRRVF